MNREERNGNRRRLSAAWAGGLAALAFGRVMLARASRESLQCRVVVITGGSRGLGLALAHEFAREGAHLAICARNENDLARAANGLAGRGADVLAIPCDVRDRDDVARFIGRVMERHGRVDVLVNNAGIISVGPVETVTVEEIEDAMAVMFRGAVYATWEVLPAMRRRRSGHIVNITSIGGRVAFPHLLPYSAAKFAATGFSEGLRAELLKDGVAVTTVIPGLMRTGSYRRAEMKGDREKEYALFGAIANLPLTSINAEAAARRIVAAVRRGEAEVILSLPARTLSLAQRLFPGLLADAMGIVARMLPAPGRCGSQAEEGRDIEARLARTAMADPLGLGRKAAERFNQRP